MSTANDSKPSVRLRAMEPEDLDTLYQMENDVEIWNVGTTNVPYSRYVLHDYVANVAGDIYTDKQVRLMIEDENGVTVGMVDLVNFSPQHRRAELSIVVKKEKRRCGFATAAVNQIRKYALDILHPPRWLLTRRATSRLSSIRLTKTAWNPPRRPMRKTAPR